MRAMAGAPPSRPPLTPRQLVQVALALAAVVAAVLLLLRPAAAPGVEVERRPPAPGIDEIRVDVSGAVSAPGVITARPGQRIDEAIAAAGGATPDADLDALNLARRVIDQDHVVVPRRGDPTARLLDLNRATQQQLEALPGIGATRASAIIASRQRAAFTSTDELVERGLVPANVYASLRDLVATPRGPGGAPAAPTAPASTGPRP